MTMYATLEEAIDAAREEFLADNPDLEPDEASVQQLSVQKYVLQDGDIMWQAEFFADEDEGEGECLPMLSGEAAQSVFDGDYDEIEIRQEWQEENTLHEWDEGEFQLEPPWIPKRVRPRPMNGMSDSLLVRSVVNVEREQQGIKHQRKWQVKDGDVAPRGVPDIPLHARIVLVSVPLPWDSSANNTAASAQQAHHDYHCQYSHLIPHGSFI